jgi:hypothetical protein
MDSSSTDLYQVYLREYRKTGDLHEVVEQPLADCSSYDEARRIQQQALRAAQDCVIRYLGPTGGGD